jgi:hypothetical protein
MKKQDSIAILCRQRDTGLSQVGKKMSDHAFAEWRRNTEVAIERIFGGQSRHILDFQNVKYTPPLWFEDDGDRAFAEAHDDGLRKACAVLNSMVTEIEEFGLADDAAEEQPDHLSLIEKLCRRFHPTARRLRQRHDDRATIEIVDEYDVQDLLHAILNLHFDDVRPEEWTPSYAGASSRVDFLLKEEQIVIEVKKTRRSMKTKELGEQLIIDRARYEAHPDCKTLVCFVYDPEGLVGNPVGMVRDLEKASRGLPTQ